jgi:hypothetical protein
MKIGGGALFMTLIIVAFFRWYSDDQKDQLAARPTGTGYSATEPQIRA